MKTPFYNKEHTKNASHHNPVQVQGIHNFDLAKVNSKLFPITKTGNNEKYSHLNLASVKSWSSQSNLLEIDSKLNRILFYLLTRQYVELSRSGDKDSLRQIQT